MTRKDYELLARVFANTNPYQRDSVWSDRDVEDRRVAYAQWERTVRALCDELEAANPAFDRSQFQYAATSRATVWLVDYRFTGVTRDEALELAGRSAAREVPGADATVMRVRQTPKGAWVVTLKRTRKAVEA